MAHIGLGVAVDADVAQGFMLLLEVSLNRIQHGLMVREYDELDIIAVEQRVQVLEDACDLSLAT